MMESFTEISRTIKTLINRGHPRSVRAKKNIIASFLFKGLNVLIGFYLVPLTIEYVQKEQYGIWLTLTSIVGWVSLFDIGLGHGLRNKLSEAIALDEWEKAKIYVSSTYAILGIIFTCLMVFFFLVEPFLKWQVILNTDSVDFNELRLVAIVTFSFFCINFVLGLINSIFYSFQRPAFNNFLNLMGSIIAITIIIILTKTTEGSLFYLALAIDISPMVVLLFISFYMFNRDFKPIAPSIRYVKKEHFKDLIGLGVRFLLVSMSGIVIFATDNMIITQLFGPSEVPAYAIAFKYFGLITVGFSFILVPMWSAYTEAYVKRDIAWVLSINKRLIQTWRILVVGGILMLAISPMFFRLWVPQIEIPFLLSIMMCLYVLILAWGNIFVNFINGVGKVKLQLLLAAIGAVINLPLSYLFAKTFNMGSAGVILASIICIAYGPLFAPIQFKRIINETAKGIWNQ